MDPSQRIKPVEPTVIKDKKIVREVIAQVRWKPAAGAITAYMPLIADAIKLSATEKELHKLEYPFKTVPAMKEGLLIIFFRFYQHGSFYHIVQQADSYNPGVVK
ncbi:MAG: hypothetical protein LBK64_05140 [Spirochaetaceae bacterium]|jgi:hypothetical protein|nr:hypothetical protein [Spirochaetaceae bacterium]